MRAVDLLQGLTQIAFLAIFFIVLRRAILRRDDVERHAMLFFGTASIIILVGRLASLAGPYADIVARLGGVLFWFLPYWLVRLLDDFNPVRTWIKRGAMLGALVSAGLLLAFGTWAPAVIAALAFFLVAMGYASIGFVGEAQATTGVTRRRMQAVATGSALLGLLLVLFVVPLAVPAISEPATLVGRGLAVAAAVAYFLGFTPPAWLRRAWQETELRRLLRHASQLSPALDLRAFTRELEQLSASAVGAADATIGLWNSERNRLQFFLQQPDTGDYPAQGPGYRRGPDVFEAEPGALFAGAAFAAQRAMYTANAERDDPQYAAIYQASGSKTILAAPLSLGESQVGVLAIYASRPPVFSDSDLPLVQLLADQIAVVLENHRNSTALARRAAAERSAEVMRKLQDLADIGLQAIGLDAVLANLPARVRAVLEGDTASILLVDEAERDLVVVASDGLRAEVEQGIRVPIGLGFAGRIAATEAPYVLDDTAGADVVSPFLREHVASLVGVPLVLEGRVRGVLHVGSITHRHFLDEEVRLLQLAAERAALAIDRARLLDEEQRARAAAEEASRARDEFLSVAAHELRTPIAGLLASVQLAQRRLTRTGTLGPAQIHSVLDSAEGQAQRLSVLISHLLDVSRLEAGKLAVAPEPTDMRQLTARVVQDLAERTPGRVATFDGKAAAAWANVDPTRIEQVLVNLLDNAFKYSPTGGAVQVEVETASDGESVCIAVRDHGVGVPPERRAELFQRFYQAHGDGYLGGMGLGLYISRQIVELHGGHLHAEFPEDGGTRMVIQLPVLLNSDAQIAG